MAKQADAYPVGCVSCDGDAIDGDAIEGVCSLKCVVQQYAWGKVGNDSLVGRLASSGQPDFKLDTTAPYAEMWVGTHPSGPSLVLDGDEPVALSDWMKVNSKKGSLPFLFKILSVRTALSIQAHPDRTLAARLHHSKPDKYKDDNHKPEMAVAITPFEAMCSFRPAAQILANLKATPELVAVVGEVAVELLEATIVPGVPTQGEPFKMALRALFEALMSSPKHVVEASLRALMDRVEGGPDGLDALASRLHAQYPGDVGVFCAYLLNYTVLQPGEALFLAANEPHAYISGDCAEIMANSDNVIRAGLTPKWMDIGTLCSCLTYTDGMPHFIAAQQDGMQGLWSYCPPTDEFMLERVQLEDTAQAILSAKDEVSILIVVEGEPTMTVLFDTFADGTDFRSSQGKRFAPGAVQLLRPHTALHVVARGPTLIFRASVQEGIRGL